MRGRRLLFLAAAPLVPPVVLLSLSMVLPGPTAVAAVVYPWRWGAVAAAIALLGAGVATVLLVRFDSSPRSRAIQHFHYSALFYLGGAYYVVERVFFCGECELLIGWVNLAIVSCAAAIVGNALVLWRRPGRAAA
jgi:hypothetical protein